VVRVLRGAGACRSRHLDQRALTAGVVLWC